MKLVVRGIQGSKHPRLSHYVPEDREDFDEYVQVLIGIKPGKGSDAFSIRVVTAKALAQLKDRKGIIAQWPVVVMDQFIFSELSDWAESIVASCQRGTWEESIEQLRKYFDYEFAGYAEH